MIGFTSRATAGVPARVEALAEAVELAGNRLSIEHTGFGRHVVDKAAARLRHGTTHTLVALLGATGSGKSSVANAIVGSDVATTGIRRPTTSSTLACYWGGGTDTGDVQPLLDWLEVANRHEVTSDGSHDLAGVVLLDVPDHDSVADAHRIEMERIAEHADMLLWVTDPEKYADKAMHDYLKGLSGHGAVMGLVLNKTDQLGPDDVERCRADLERLITGAGLDDVPIVTMSATGGDGVDRLRALLVETGERQQAMVDRLAADLTLAAGDLLTELGPTHGPTEVSDRVADGLADELVGASGLAVVSDAVAAGHRRDAAKLTGWPFTRWVRRLRPHPLGRFHLGEGSAGRASLPEPSGVQLARTENAVRQAAAAAAGDLPDPWPTLIAAAGTPDQTVLTDRLDAAIADSVRDKRGRRPHWWRAVNGLQLLLAATVVVGLVWLGLLAVAAYFRIPEPPVPEVRDVPVPTGLVLGGIAIGLLLAFSSARFAAVGAARRRRAVRARSVKAVRSVADELVIDPIQRELDRRQELRALLLRAGGA